MSESKLSNEEKSRYSRHLVLPHFGESAQLLLRKARVLVVGAGGLGAPVLSYLTAAGVGEIGIADFDHIALSNLQRQVLFSTEDIDKPKSIVAAERLRKQNPQTTVHTINERITSGNAIGIAENYDVIIDCTDDFPTRYLLNDTCVLSNIPLVYGSIFRYEGQVCIFNYQNGPTYRDLYAVPPDPGSVPDCASGGVLGTLPGIIGSIQANEVIKLITGIGELLAGRLLVYDSLTNDMQVFQIPNQNQRANVKKLIDYDEFCGLSREKKESWPMKEVTVQELKQLMDSKSNFQLIDVREPHEFDICNLGGELIPMADVPENADKLAQDKQVVVHCRSGKRSGDVINWLEKNKGYTNLYNLKGGILAWAKEIDPSMPVY